MGRRSIYITADQRRKVRAERENKELETNEEKHQLKNKQDRERQQEIRTGENSRRKIGSLSHAADVAESLTQLDNRHSDEQCTEKNELIVNVQDENISMRFQGEISNGYESGMKIISLD